MVWGLCRPETAQSSRRVRFHALQTSDALGAAAAQLGPPAVLGADFAGVLVRDGWAPSRRFTAAAHQTCLAHLLRRCRLVGGGFATLLVVAIVRAAWPQLFRIGPLHTLAPRDTCPP